MWCSRGLYSSVLNPQKKKKKKYRDPLKEKINEKSFLITTASFSCRSGERHGGAGACAPQQQTPRVAWLGCAPRPDIRMSLSWAVSWERTGFNMEQGAQGARSVRALRDRERCWSSEGKGTEKGRQGAKLTILQEQTMLPGAAVNKITAAG